MYLLGLFEDITAEKYNLGEIAAAVLYLSSDMGMFITGHTLVVDGGQTIN